MVSVHNAKFRDSIFKCKSTSHNNKNNNNCLHTGLAHIKKILHEIPINERNFYPNGPFAQKSLIILSF